jgi:UDP-N-acetyl-D-glucosamine dehydrogenase
MPGYAAGRVAYLLNDRGLPVYGTRLLAVGIAFKPNVSDDRESPALDVLAELRQLGADITVWDPLVGSDRIEAHGYSAAEGPTEAAAALVLTDHDLFDYKALSAAVPVVFDARGAFRRRGITADNVVTL